MAVKFVLGLPAGLVASYIVTFVLGVFGIVLTPPDTMIMTFLLSIAGGLLFTYLPVLRDFSPEHQRAINQARKFRDLRYQQLVEEQQRLLGLGVKGPDVAEKLQPKFDALDEEFDERIREIEGSVFVKPKRGRKRKALPPRKQRPKPDRED